MSRSGSPLSGPVGSTVTVTVTATKRANTLAKQLDYLLKINTELAKTKRGGVVEVDAVNPHTGQLEHVMINRENFKDLVSAYKKEIRELPKEAKRARREAGACSRLVSSFSNPTMYRDNMRAFVRDQVLKHANAASDLGELVPVIEQTVVRDGFASQTILNTLFTMYTYWEDLSRLASDNAGMQPNNVNYKLNVYGSPPELAALFSSYMPELQAIQDRLGAELPPNPTPKQVQKATKVFRVDNFKISDRSKIFGVARDRAAENANVGNLKDVEGMKAYRKLVEQQCLATVGSRPDLRLDDPDLKDKISINYQELVAGSALAGRPAIELRAQLDNLRQALKERNDRVGKREEIRRKAIGRPKKKKSRSPRR